MSALQRLLTGDRRDPRSVLEEIFGTTARAGSPQLEAQQWARGVLAEAAIDASSSPVAAIRALRRAEPRLTLRPARYLVASL